VQSVFVSSMRDGVPWHCLGPRLLQGGKTPKDSVPTGDLHSPFSVLNRSMLFTKFQASALYTRHLTILGALHQGRILETVWEYDCHHCSYRQTGMSPQGPMRATVRANKSRWWRALKIRMPTAQNSVLRSLKNPPSAVGAGRDEDY
jgi:hypothetical protein